MSKFYFILLVVLACLETISNTNELNIPKQINTKSISLKHVYLLTNNPFYREEHAYKCINYFYLNDYVQAIKISKPNNRGGIYSPPLFNLITDNECRTMVQEKKCLNNDMLCDHEHCVYDLSMETSTNSSLIYCDFKKVKINSRVTPFDETCKYEDGTCSILFERYSWDVIENNDHYLIVKRLALLTDGNNHHFPGSNFTIQTLGKINEQVFKTNIFGLYLAYESDNLQYQYLNSYSEDWSLDTVFLLASNPIYKEEFAYKCTVRYLIKDQSEADKKGFRINNMEFHPVQTLYLTDSECQRMVQTKR